MNHKARIGVAVSGGGRSLENLLTASGAMNFEVGAVISSNESCRAVQFAKDSGIPVFVGKFDQTFDRSALYEWLRVNRIQWLVLAGFIKLFPLDPVWRGRVINIHPALLPKFGGRGMYGLRVHEAVIAAKEARSGATVHFVDDRYDEGEIIAQMEVPVLVDDDASTLAARVFAAESALLPNVVNALVQGKVRLRD